MNSCDVVVDDLFNIEIKMKPNLELKPDLLTGSESVTQSMRTIPTFNHANVRKV